MIWQPWHSSSLKFLYFAKKTLEVLFLLETKLWSAKYNSRYMNCHFDRRFVVDVEACVGRLSQFWFFLVNLKIVSYSNNFFEVYILNYADILIWHSIGHSTHIKIYLHWWWKRYCQFRLHNHPRDLQYEGSSIPVIFETNWIAAQILNFSGPSQK